MIYNGENEKHDLIAISSIKRVKIIIYENKG
jgi:hypothetical protein